METDVTFLDILPWEDVLFKSVFPYLPLKSLFYLRGCSHHCLDCVTDYFRTTSVINLSLVGHCFNADAFRLMTENSELLQILILRQSGKWLSDSALVPVLDRSKKLKKIDFAHCMSISNSSIQKLAISCPEIEDICLRNCHWVSLEAVTVISMNCQKLQKIDLTGCWQINDDAVSALVMLCKGLRFLSLAKIYGLTDTAIIYIARNCVHLQYLNIQGCWRVTNKSIRYIGEYSKELQTLQVKECNEVNETSLARLRTKGVKVDVQQPSYMMKPEFANYLQKLKLQI